MTKHPHDESLNHNKKDTKVTQNCHKMDDFINTREYDFFFYMCQPY
jgi:hypothetical protein